MSPEEPTPLRAENIALVTGIVLVLFVTLGGFAQTMHAPTGIWFTEVFIFLGSAHVVLRWQRRRALDYLGLRQFSWGLFAIGAFIGVFNFVAVVAPIQFVMQMVAPPSWKDFADVSKIFEHQTQWELTLIVLSVSIAAPVCEEVFFRGVLQQNLQESGVRLIFAIAVSAVLFSAFHLDPLGFVARVELAVLFSLLFWRTGSLWPAIAAHSGNNALSSILYFTSSGDNEEVTASSVLLLSASGWAVLFCIWLAIRSHLPPRSEANAPFLIASREGAPEHALIALTRWIAAAGFALLIVLLMAKLRH